MHQDSGRLQALDGLRGVAILAVLANHTGHSLGRGGYLGVDVFFVLSGYLITGLLLRERERNGRVRIGYFYARRALRLYPALIVTIIFVALLALLGAVERENLGTHVFFAFFYLQDLANAFGIGPALGPLNFTWSLAIEEHFYLLWPPLMLLVVLRGDRRAVVAVSALLALASFTAMQLLFEPSTSPTSEVYYHPEARVAAMLVGCALAAASVRKIPSWLVAVAAFGLVIVLVVAPEANVRVVYLAMMPAVWICTSVLIVGGTLAVGMPSRLLRWRPLAWIGAISYGLYLYHGPMFVAVEHFTGSSRTVVVALGLLASLAAAAASFYFIERWFNELKDRRFSTRAAPTQDRLNAP